jgi:hypothetical protein
LQRFRLGPHGDVGTRASALGHGVEQRARREGVADDVELEIGSPLAQRGARARRGTAVVCDDDRADAVAVCLVAGVNVTEDCARRFGADALEVGAESHVRVLEPAQDERPAPTTTTRPGCAAAAGASSRGSRIAGSTEHHTGRPLYSRPMQPSLMLMHGRARAPLPRRRRSFAPPRQGCCANVVCGACPRFIATCRATC